tara:strand:- start:327 stop:431 length:105 start_codon:yes stop_codon:yes gene_type:complete
LSLVQEILIKDVLAPPIDNLPKKLSTKEANRGKK